MTDRDSLIPDVDPPEPLLAIHPLDLIELHARRLLTEWERADWKNRSVGVCDDAVVASDRAQRTKSGDPKTWEAPDHVELADVMGLGNLA